MKFRFVCPICGNEAAVEDFRPYKDKGATSNSATCECIGRYAGAGPAFGDKRHKPCDYAGYGLFRLSPVRVKIESGEEIHCFAFAEPHGTANASPKALEPSPEVN
jgi:hypothetical protein